MTNWTTQDGRSLVPLAGGPVVWTPPSPPDVEFPEGNLEISLSSTSVLPGEVIYFDAGFDETDNGFYTADFVWTLGQPEAQFENYDARTPVPNDANTFWQPSFAMGYDQPGTYEVRCVARRADGETFERRQTVTVRDPEAESWARIIYVSPSGNFTGAPSVGGVVEHLSDLSTLNSRLDVTGPVALYLRRGETYNTAGVRKATAGTFYVDAWGEGAKPVFSQSSGQTSFFLLGNSNADIMVIRNVRAVAGYDPIARAWDPNQSRNTFAQMLRDGDFATIPAAFSFWRCEGQGLRQNLYPEVRFASRFALVDCDFRDWQFYGMICACNMMAVTGGMFLHPEEAFPVEANDDNPRYSAFRIAPGGTGGGLRFAKTCIVSRGGDQGAAQGAGRLEQQPAVRIDQERSIDENTGRMVFAHSYISPSITLRAPTWAQGTPYSEGPLCLVDAVHMVSTYGTYENVKIAIPKTHVRNSFIIMPDDDVITNTFAGGPDMHAGDFERYSQAARDAGDVAVYNCTIVTEQGPERDGRGNLGALTGATSTAPSAQWDNVLIGPNALNAGSLPDWSPVSAEYRPLEGSAAIGEAAGPSPRRDATATIRPSPASVGAFEPD